MLPDFLGKKFCAVDYQRRLLRAHRIQSPSAAAAVKFTPKLKTLINETGYFQL